MGADDLPRRVEEALKSLPKDEKAEVIDSTQAETDPIKEITAPLDGLPDDAPLGKVEGTLRSLALSLDGADSLRRATVREAAIQKLEKVKGINAPSKMVDAAFKNGEAGSPNQQQGRPVVFDDPEPWPEAVDGAALLDDITTTLKYFLVLPPHTAEAVALWICHACALEAFTISPILAICSPTKGSGKTLLLDVISYLLVKKLFVSNTTPATLFRCVDKFTPCLLIDEADTFLKDNEELRGILNAGHRRSSAFVMRTVGDEHEPVIFVTWCAKAIAIIGKLPETLEDRSIVVSMKRKSGNEKINEFRANKMEPSLTNCKRKIMKWTADNLNALRKADPGTLDGLTNRLADNWRPLLAIADLAGGKWPETARTVAKGLSNSVDEGSNSVSIQLLVDLQDLFTARDTDNISSEDICKTLGEMEEKPWSEWRRGKPITTRQLAKLLAGFKISPKTIRIGKETAKGYTLEQLADAFSRYPSPSSPNTPLSSVTSVTSDIEQELTPSFDPSQEGSVTDGKTDLSIENKKDVTDVTDENPLFPEGEGYEEEL